MRFASPLSLLLLVPLASLLWLELRKRTGAVRFSDTSFFASHSNRGAWCKRAGLALTFAALLMMVLALARPQRGRVYEQTEAKGVDIMLCLDISGTMKAEDFSPKNRLYVAKERAKEFIVKRAGDRIGLVVFAGQALIQCPLSFDRAVINALIDRVDFGLVADGTAIGMGLASAVSRVKGSKSKDRIIILLTDGLNNAGEIDPLTAAQVARSYGIKVYCIGVGSTGPVPVPVDDPMWGRRYVQAAVDLDMKTLDEVAAITGGQAFLASDAAGLKLIYDEIDKMEPTTYKVNKHTVYSEKAHLFLIPAGLLFLLSLLFSAVIMRKLP